MKKLIKTNNYKFLVSTHNLKNYPCCKWPRELPREGTIRGFRTVYFDSNNGIQKEIIYSQNFWLELIEKNDPLELAIIDIKNNWPDWYLIHVI
jgi:hypothetical protein